MKQTNERIALVLGATGGIGGEMTATLLRRGWQVRAPHRDPDRAAAGWAGGTAPIWLAGDAMDTASVVTAAEGASLIVHGVTPPKYRDWDKLVLPMLDNSIEAAKRSGARLLVPGSVYNYGPDALPDLGEDAPQNPSTRKGAIRVQMERRLRQAGDRGVRSIVVRAGDYFGARAASSWFAQLVKPGRGVAAISYPGRRGVGHQWGYLPDVAEAMMRLVEQGDRLGPFEVFNMQGHWDADGTQMIEAIRAAIGRNVPARRFPWWLVTASAPIVPLFRELREMRYLWRQPVRLLNPRLVAVLGHEPHTPLQAAVHATLEGFGCLVSGPAPTKSVASAIDGGTL